METSGGTLVRSTIPRRRSIRKNGAPMIAGSSQMWYTSGAGGNSGCTAVKTLASRTMSWAFGATGPSGARQHALAPADDQKIRQIRVAARELFHVDAPIDAVHLVEEIGGERGQVQF